MIPSPRTLMGGACMALSRTSPITQRPMICGVRDKDKPMIFRGTDWCSEWHRQMVEEQRRKARLTARATMEAMKMGDQ